MKQRYKKELRLMLDYQCYPIWIYDEAGNFIDKESVKIVDFYEKIGSNGFINIKRMQ